MTARQITLNILIGLGVIAFIAVVGILEVVPFWVALIVAAILWIVYLVLVLRDNAREKRYPVLRYNGNPADLNKRIPRAAQTTVYNQEEDKE